LAAQSAASIQAIARAAGGVLLAFALEYEGKSELSLAMSANVVRVLDGITVREVPRGKHVLGDCGTFPCVT